MSIFSEQVALNLGDFLFRVHFGVTVLFSALHTFVYNYVLEHFADTPPVEVAHI